MSINLKVLSHRLPSALPSLGALAARGLATLDPAADVDYASWSPGAGVLRAVLGPIFKRLREEGGVPQKSVRRRFLHPNPAQTDLVPTRHSGQLSRRERDLLARGCVPMACHDLHQLSVALDDLWAAQGLSDDAVRGILAAVFDDCPVPAQAAGGRALAALLACVDHLLGGRPPDPAKLDALGVAVSLAREVGAWLEAVPLSRRSSTRQPGRTNAHTPHDREAHDRLSDGIRAADPAAVVLSEENRESWRMAADGRTIERFVAGVWQPLRPGAEVYLVDPLDGTLIWQIGGGFAVMIALGRVVDGRDGPAVEWFGAVVCLPKSREVMFGLVGGGGLWLDYGNCRVSPLRASREACLRHAKVATHLSSQEKNRPLVERFIAHQLTPLARAAERILMQGCQGAQMAAVATGQYDAFISVQSGGPWDYLPPALLLGVAGGLVRSFVNAPLGLRDLGVVAAGSADLYLNLRALLDLGLYAPADFPPPPVP